jgi:uncharacterized Zn-binding protein involved in type VI secretion
MKIFDINGLEQGLDGDLTTTGAICHASLVQTSLEDGRMALRLGDKTSPCGVCGQVGEIVEGDDSFTWDGIPTAVHDALVLCACPPGTNRLIASRSGRAAASRAAPDAAAAPHPTMPTPNTPSSLYPHTTPAPGKIFARAFAIRDSETGQPLANRTFTATVDGQQKSGTTDSNGMARVEIALHHAGRIYSCGEGANQMREALRTHPEEKKFDDIGYHFGIDCSGIVYEGGDIRFKASGVELYNTAVISIVLLNNLTTTEEGGGPTAWGRSVLDAIGFSTTNEIPLQQADATLNLVNALKSVFNITRLGGHKEFPRQKANGKICPGDVGMTLVNLIRLKTSLNRPPEA